MSQQKTLASCFFALFVCCVLAFGSAATAGQPADETHVLLAGIGLENLEIISETQAESVKGLGIGSSGTSLLIGSLVDPSTGSTANFFQIQSSGSEGASASHSNMINANFGWTIGGILQRFQAEIGGYGYAYGR